jgi:hypothetical protein
MYLDRETVNQKVEFVDPDKKIQEQKSLQDGQSGFSGYFNGEREEL